MIEKIKIETTSKTLSTGVIYVKGESTDDRAKLILKGVKIDISTASDSGVNGTSALKYERYSDITCENLNDAFPIEINVAGERTGTGTKTYNVAVFNNNSDGNELIINSGYYNVIAHTKSETDEKTGAYIYMAKSGFITGKLNINGGAFTLASDNIKSVSNASPKAAIVVNEGGIFNFKPDTFWGEGYSAAANDNIETNVAYPWKIVRSNAVKINNIEYLTIQDAINAANEGDTIILLRNEVVEESLVVNKNVTIKKGEYILTLKGAPTIVLSEGVEMPSAIDESCVATITNSDGSVEYYKTFEKALSTARSGQTIKLIDNVNLTATISTIGQNYTIDMNGFDITSTKNQAFKYTGGTVASVKNINISFVNNNVSDTESILTGGIEINAREYSYTLTINDGVKVIAELPLAIWGNGKKDSIVANIYGKLEVNEGSNITAIQGNGSNEYGGTTVNIYDGAVIKGEIFQPQEGILNVYGGTITGNTGIEIRAGKLNIIDGTITGTGVSTIAQANGNGGTTSGAGVAIAQHTTKLPIDVTISGGTIKGYTALYESNPQENEAEDIEKVAINITGGNFETTNSGQNVIYSEDCEKFITNAYFKIIPDTKYIATGYKVISGTWGEYTYKVAAVPANKIESAIAVVKTGEDGATTEQVSATLNNTKIKITGAISAANKIEVTGTCTDGKEVTFGNITYNNGNFVIATPTSVTVGSSKYTLDLTDLTVLPASVVVTESETKVETSIQAPTQDETNVINAINSNPEKVNASGLSIASDVVVTKTKRDGSTVTTVQVGENETKTLEEVIAAAKDTDNVPETIANSDELVVVVKPIIKVELKEVVEGADGKKTISLDISALSQAIVTTESVISGDTEIETTGISQNAVKVGEEVPVKVNTTITITIPLPEGFITNENGDNLFVKHQMHNGKTETIKATVDMANNTITFTLKGLSPVEVVVDDRICTIDFVGTDTSMQYRADNIGTAFPAALAKTGYRGIGWKITDKDGEVIEYTLDDNTEQIDGTYNAMSELLLTALNGQTVNATAQYTKVSSSSGGGGGSTSKKEDEITWKNASKWAIPELKLARDNKLIPEKLNGADMTTKITREEFAAVAVKLYEKLSGEKATADTENPFVDTTDAEILKAYKLGITNGTSETTFEPEREITREEMATMLTRAVVKAGKSTKYEVENKYADDETISEWAKDSIYFMTSINAIEGIGDNTFSPKTDSTKEQALAITQRVVSNI